MKNLLVITSDGEQLISSIHDATNRLFINGSEINSVNWVGSGNYTDTIEGHEITISKTPDLNGNIILIKNSNYNYSLLKDSSGEGGATSYNDLSDKPMIEGITLQVNKTYEELNLQRITNSEIEDLLTV